MIPPFLTNRDRSSNISPQNAGSSFLRNCVKKNQIPIFQLIIVMSSRSSFIQLNRFSFWFQVTQELKLNSDQQRKKRDSLQWFALPGSNHQCAHTGCFTNVCTLLRDFFQTTLEFSVFTSTQTYMA